MKKKKVLFLMYSMGESRGTEKLFSQLSYKLDYKYEFFFVSLYDIKPYEDFRGNYIFLNKGEKINIFHVFKSIISIRKIIRNNNIDVVIGTNDYLNIILLISSIFTATEKIASIHSNPLLNFNNIVKKYIIKIFYPIFDTIVCVSKSQENIMIEKFKLRNTKTIYNFLDIDAELLKFREPLNNSEESVFKNAFSFLMISRLDKLKGFLPTLRIFKKLIKAYKNINLIIIGEGEYRKHIEEYIFQNKLENNIYLFGSKRNIYPYLLKSDCFLLPTLSEAFGLVIIEALLTNKLIVSTDCYVGPKEILNNNYDFTIKKYPYYGDFGVLIESFDTSDLRKYELKPNQDLDTKEILFSNLLEDIYINKKSYQKEYNNGVVRAREYDINNIVEYWKEIIG